MNCLSISIWGTQIYFKTAVCAIEESFNLKNFIMLALRLLVVSKWEQNEIMTQADGKDILTIILGNVANLGSFNLETKYRNCQLQVFPKSHCSKNLWKIFAFFFCEKFSRKFIWPSLNLNYKKIRPRQACFPKLSEIFKTITFSCRRLFQKKKNIPKNNLQKKSRVKKCFREGKSRQQGCLTPSFFLNLGKFSAILPEIKKFCCLFPHPHQYYLRKKNRIQAKH